MIRRRMTSSNVEKPVWGFKTRGIDKGMKVSGKIRKEKLIRVL